MSTEPPATLTLAALYLKQGLQGRARKLYSDLAGSRDPLVAREAAERLRVLGPGAQPVIELLQELLRRIGERRKMVL